MKRRLSTTLGTMQPALPYLSQPALRDLVREEVQRWLWGLRLRPFVWLCPAIVLGCVLGVQFARTFTFPSRDEWLLWWPAALSALCAALSWHHRARPAVARGLVFMTLTLACTTYAARRVLPPPTDISQLLKTTINRTQPLRPLALHLHGRIVSSPRHSEFGQTFVLECERVDSTGATTENVIQSTLERTGGRVWIEAPLGVTLQQDDRVLLRAELMELPRTGHNSERERQWRYLLHSCWSRARLKETSDAQIVEKASPTALSQRIAVWRQAIRERFEDAFVGSGTIPRYTYPRATAQLLTAMTFGEGGLSEPLPALTRDAFRAAGLSHVLVASGAQVGFVAVLLIGLCHLIGVRGGWMLLLVVPCLTIYALLAGSAPSIWRATIAGICVCGALAAGRENDGLSLWSLALGVLLLLDPASLFDLSLQLTFGATWGLIVLAPTLRDWLQRVFPTGRNQSDNDRNDADLHESAPHPLSGAIAFSLGAQWGTLPIVLYHFGSFSVIGLGANFLGVPLAGTLVFSGLAGLAIAPVNVLNYWLTRAMAGIAHTAAGVPGAQLETAPLDLGWTLFCYLVFLAALIPTAMVANISRRSATRHGGRIDWAGLVDAARDEWRRAQRRAQGRWHQSSFHRSPHPWLVGGVGLLCIVGSVWWWRARTAPLLVTFLDVGQGECIIIKSPQGRVLMIDGGSIDT
ncbi:MAG: competence protein ComEC, partial [Abditibacteriota bacterium]|nr:competence protein ComEC [Abditibacteriota bacterium]